MARKNPTQFAGFFRFWMKLFSIAFPKTALRGKCWKQLVQKHANPVFVNNERPCVFQIDTRLIKIRSPGEVLINKYNYFGMFPVHF
jgi:hypothetical protein